MAKQGGQTPLYEQVVKMVKDQIVSGVYTKGDLLPSEKEMLIILGSVESPSGKHYRFCLIWVISEQKKGGGAK